MGKVEIKRSWPGQEWRASVTSPTTGGVWDGAATGTTVKSRLRITSPFD